VTDDSTPHRILFQSAVYAQQRAWDEHMAAEQEHLATIYQMIYAGQGRGMSATPRPGAFGGGGAGAVEQVPLALPETSLLLQAVVEVGEKTNEGELIIGVTLPWFEIIAAMHKDPRLVLELSPRKWEEMIAGVYRRAGWDNVILTPRSGDGGRDVIAEKRGVGTVRIIEQVKAYKPGHLVTADEARSLLGALEMDGASKGFLTTTSDFAPGLRKNPEWREYIPSRMELVNGSELLARLKELWGPLGR
jgi:restriction system protein